MEQLQIFSNEEFGEIRTVTVNNEPMFCLTDVCRVLEIKNPSQTKTRLKKDGVISNEVIDSLGRTQTADFINESNMYKLIFQSRKPQAEKFSDWVTSEVLPTLRKTGHFEMEGYSPEMQAILMQDKKIVKMEGRMNHLENDIPLYGCEADELSAHVKKKGVDVLGGKDSIAYKDKEIRSKVFRDIYDQLKREFGIYNDDGKMRSYKALKRRYLEKAHAYIDRYTPSVYLLELITEAKEG